MLTSSWQIKDPKVLLHIFFTICGLAPTTALWSYAPTIVGSFGFGRLQANALVSVGQWISVFLIIVAGFAADKTGRRGLVVLFGVLCQWTFMVAFRGLPDDSSAGLKFGILTMGTATCSWWHSVNGSWLSINASCPEKRAIRMALFIMAANCAGIVGGQLFRSDDLPYYHRGWSVIVGLMSTALFSASILAVLYWRANVSLRKSGTENGSMEEAMSNVQSEKTTLYQRQELPASLKANRKHVKNVRGSKFDATNEFLVADALDSQKPAQENCITALEPSMTDGGLDESFSHLEGNSPTTTETPGSHLSSNSEVYSIQAIVLSTRVAHNLNQSNLNATLVGAAIRIAHNLGLHKIESDPKICVETREGWHKTIETEVGRRCWNQLVIQDYFQIPFTGTYIIHPWHYTTSLPINCHDEDMMVREEETPTINSYPRTLSRIASLMPRLMDGLGPATAPYTLADVARHVARSDQDLRKIMRDAPRFLRVQTEDEADSFSWLPAARHSLTLSAADKIIMIHRPTLYHSFQLPALTRTRTTCVAAAMTIFHAYEYISKELTVPIWIHSAFCVTAAMVIGLELLFRESHVDDEARRLRAAMTVAAQRLRSQKSDVIAERGVALIDTVLGVEEDLVIKVMRLTHSDDQSLKSAQRDIVNNMIADNTIMAKFLALSPAVDGNFCLDTGGFQVDDWLGDATEWFRDGEPDFLNSFDMVYPYTSVD
ncbi:hypothetical protein FSARC_3469 [Fusarium sarcochroum]|uniref:Xylanolytic transcriptional activator regulatory domain-containing protein n=1 Tax=Fusarium sarcochroum TaxID=1208366 RepID=A0A8H4U492_9HYPO|nr:hypothetical protein FSARC_3469 [Fusarium sarcochroum]